MPSWTDNVRDRGDDGAFDRLSRLVEQEEQILHSAFQTAYSHENLSLSDPRDPGVIGMLMMLGASSRFP